MNDLDDATIAAVDYIMDHLGALPADRGRVEWFFWEILTTYAEVVIAAERRKIQEPSNN
jgi:hypothetical protein